MTYGNFWGGEVWSVVLLCSVLLLGMLAAHMLKQLIKPLRESLMPSSVLGGLILLLACVLTKTICGKYLFELEAFNTGNLSGINVLEIFTYHSLAIGFIAMALRQGKAAFDAKRREEIFNTGVTTVATYLLQASLGLIITIASSFVIPKLLKASGVLLALGYGQGTGQALNYGSVYETSFGFVGGKSFGLSIAAMGFLCASLCGVWCLNAMKKKGYVPVKENNEVRLRSVDIEGENEIPMTSSMDKLTVQIAIIASIYGVAYMLMYFLGKAAGDGLAATVYGFNFLIGTICAVIFKGIYRIFRKNSIIQREYINDFLLNRISGFAFDVMITAGIAAIRLDIIAQYAWVLLALGIAGAVSTYIYLKFVCKKLFAAYENEQFAAMFGMLTGTASTGVILLRELDPQFSSPAGENLVYQNLPAILFGFPIMLLVAYAPTSDSATYITLIVCIALFAAMNGILFRKSLLSKKK